MDRDEALNLLHGGSKGIAEWNRRRHTRHKIPDLSFATLLSANLRGANLRNVDLTNAGLNFVDLTNADLSGAKLYSAELRGAVLDGAVLGNAILDGAMLASASLAAAKFHGAILCDADLRDATCASTIFANVDLSRATGLDSVVHHGPSTLGIDTIFRSKGKIPEVFLRGCGVPDALIEYLPSLIRSKNPIQFYSCFISHSTADEEFPSRLHNDFQAAGIRCWKWDHDARTGRSLWGEIDQAIRVYDKLVLIASKSSLKSPAVNREIERAIVQEDERLKLSGKAGKQIDADVLFPVTLDDYVFTKWKHERKVDVTKKVIADAKGWASDAAIYAKVRDKLIRDLKADASAGSAAPASRPSRSKKPR
jgi:TIR domain/Pentapeptide repeats (8 copies)